MEMEINCTLIPNGQVKDEKKETGHLTKCCFPNETAYFMQMTYK